MTIKLDRMEALRYLRAADAGPELRRQVEEMARLVESRCAPRYVFKICSIRQTRDGVLLPEANLMLPGGMTKRILSPCRQAALMACTLGAGFDALLRTWQTRDMAAAVIIDACGSALVEAGCGQAEQEIAALFPGKYLTDRFSPGYDDLPLTLQESMLAALDAGKRLGVQATRSSLLIPGKSVTAIAGVADAPQKSPIRGCEFCSFKDQCDVRKGGASCAE